MKRLLDAINANPKPFVVGAAVLVLTVVLIVGMRWAGGALNESRINNLEAEKQQILKERDEARARDLILQGQIQAQDKVIEALTAQLANSEAKVSYAHKETSRARTKYETVRNSAPQFDSSDDSARVAELGAKLRRLYPDSP